MRTKKKLSRLFSGCWNCPPPDKISGSLQYNTYVTVSILEWTIYIGGGIFVGDFCFGKIALFSLFLWNKIQMPKLKLLQ